MLLSRIGPIALEEPLGGSADSNVLRGVHIERNKAMAVKLLPRSLVDRPMGGDSYAEDVKRLQKLVHPNIVRVLGGAMDSGQPYLALEFVKGESLRDLLDRRGRLPWETMVDIAEGICQALEFAHAQGVVHRRLTPSRVLIGEDGVVKLVGFDCALADQDQVAALKSPMCVLNYLAPQEIRGKRSVGLPSNDLFSLGVILYEGLSGQLPWLAKSPAELINARLAAPAPRASAKVLDCPVWLDVLVARLLEVKREGRLASADAARRAILDAKGKAAGGVGAVQHAWSGKQGALATSVDKKELSRLRKASAPAEKKVVSSFYERAWFLAACLAAVIGLGAWVMWPLGEDALYAKAKPLMESELATDWQQAQTGYVEELLRRFPQTKYLPEIEAFQLRNAVHTAEQRIKNLDRFGREPESELDRLYAEAWRYERFGDRLTAWRKYEAMLKVYGTNKDLTLEERAIVELAKQRYAAIRFEAREQQKLGAIVQAQLDRADDLAKTNPVAAREVLQNVIELYDGNLEVASMVAQARDRVRKLQGDEGTAE